jgi:hypothetical protein
VDRAKERRKRRVGAAEESEPEGTQPRELGTRVEACLERREPRAARLADEMSVAGRREGRQRELVHAASSFGDR